MVIISILADANFGNGHNSTTLIALSWARSSPCDGEKFQGDKNLI